MQILSRNKKTWSDEDKNHLCLFTGKGGLMSLDVGVLNQHYTRYSVIDFIWRQLGQLGFNEGWVLEPGCGVGNFAGMKPSENINLLMFDYDQPAIEIAQILYPQDQAVLSDVKDFDFTSHKSYITAAVGNVPFGNYKRFKRDDPFAKLKPLIHDHFILRMIDTVRPGGLVAVISSTGTADKKNDTIRRSMVDMAHFLGSYRLPNTTFKANASTVVTTDILFFQKRGNVTGLSERDRQFIASQPVTADQPDVSMNSYYHAHPEQVLGRLEVGRGQYGSQLGVTGKLGQATLDRILATGSLRAIEPVPARIEQPKDLGKHKKVSLSPEIASTEEILYKLKELISYQKSGAPDQEKKTVRAELKDLIKGHLKKYSLFSRSNAVKTYYEKTSDYYQLNALVDKDGRFSKILDQDTLYSQKYQPKISDPNRMSDVLLYCHQKGIVTSTDSLARILGLTNQETAKRLGADPDVFYNPETTLWQLRFEYIAGNLWEKLQIAEQAGLAKNKKALLEKLPLPKEASQIAFDITDVNTYLPIEVARAYVAYATGGELAGVKRNWSVRNYDPSRAYRGGWGWKSDYAVLLELYLNGKSYPKERVAKNAGEQEKEKAKSDQIVNNNKMRRTIPKRFRDWIVNVASSELREKAVREWNHRYNSTIQPDFTGDTFSLANLGSTWTNGGLLEPRIHQKIFVEKALYQGSFVNAHGVGAGKTLSAIMLAGALKERGLANKPLIAAPSKVIEKWIAEYMAAFPGSNVLNLKTSKREKELYLSLAQMNDYDAIFVTHEGLSAIPPSPELAKEYLQLRMKRIDQDLEKLKTQLGITKFNAAVSSAAGNKVRLGDPLQKTVKRLLLEKVKLEQKISTALQGRKLNSIYFDEIGVDCMIIDEAHNFKNMYLSALAVELGIGVNSSSDRAEEMGMKAYFINKMMGNRNLFLLTATPTNNTPLEAYLFLSIIAPEYVKKLGFEDVDSFIQQFANIETVQTADMMGNIKDKTVVSGYKNLGVLRGIFNKYFEYIATEDFEEVTRPEAHYLPVYLDPTTKDKVVREHLDYRMTSIKGLSPMKTRNGKDDNYLYVATSGSRAAVDPAFYIEPVIEAPDPDSSEYLYTVLLHDGKNENQYEYMVWREPVTPYQRSKIVHGLNGPETSGLLASLKKRKQDGDGSNELDEQINRILNGQKDRFDNNISGREMYEYLCLALEGAPFERKGYSGKTTSLFLLKNGIDGIKFRANAGSSKAYNYVVFDEANVTIEKVIRQNPIRAYHGTGTKFDRFSTRFIGKGEGFHAFGWGLYFTESQGIAQSYSSQIAGKKTTKVALDTGAIDPGSKTGVMCQRIKENYWEKPKDVRDADGKLTKNVLNGQLVFCDPLTTVAKHDFHKMIKDKLVAMGIPAGQIAIVNGKVNNTAAKKKAVQDKFNAGDYRIIIGNTNSMGEGMDLNHYCTDIHHLDVPWKPSELTQRNGRGLRQGNVNGTINIHYYLLRKSMDAYRYSLLNLKARWIQELWHGSEDTADAEENESGWDYETIMMALLDDPDKIEALKLSRNIKQAIQYFENAKDDVTSMANAAEDTAIEKEKFARNNNSIGYRDIQSIPELPTTSFDDLVASGYLARIPYGGFLADGRHISPDETFKISGIPDIKAGYRSLPAVTIEFTSRPIGGTYYAYVRRIGNDFYTRDTDLGKLKSKIVGALDRFIASYPTTRQKILDHYSDLHYLVKNYRHRQEEVRIEAYQFALALLDKIREMDAYIQGKPATARYFDEDKIRPYRLELTSQEAMMRKALADFKAQDGQRENPARQKVDPLVYLGTTDRFFTNGIEFRGKSYLFATQTGDRLYIIPLDKVRPTKIPKSVSTKKAEQMFAEFNHYGADNHDYIIDLPEGRALKIGYARRIYYSSDKILQPGDRKGKVHHYYHDFDRNKRAVYRLGDVLIIDKVRVNGRGILN